MEVNSSATTGPFDVYLADMKYCPEPSKGIEFEFKLQRQSRKNVVISANVTINVPLDDELDVSVNLAKQTSQGWKENYFILEVPKACSTMKLYVPAMEQDLARQMNLKHCPYPVGNYSLSVPLEINVGVFPVFPYGKYLSKVSVMKKKKRVFCIHGFVNVVPKKSG
ncbi:hypothetical protein GE061_015254 [Apolygus lucorum]|uniref:MD-2-related lipid-recognition domain-containing protein n=1 Tax=Apolygus lucorum TaxID=248454 RepID=A0A8S9XKJ8_APOLU|nr:hypothetical protein GE061_015254 [Apolygus lucorum]